MNICKSILKRIGLVALMVVGVPVALVVFAVIMTLVGVCAILGTIFACLFCSDDQIQTYFNSDNTEYILD